MKLSLNDIDVLIFDFDGVLTNNYVYVDEIGKEWVSCNRADGLAFDVLKKLKKPVFIVSTEKNPVVSARARKLGVPVIQSVRNKATEVAKLLNNNGFSFSRTLYVGNDLNDFRVMQLCGYTVCPSNSHKQIRNIATFVTKTVGGDGVVRELLEEIFNLNFIEILYPE